jgi:bifunctional non-homologous end joining protein LigD
MLARSGPLPEADDVVLELKFDGCRFQVRVDGAHWKLRSRPGRDCTDSFPELATLAEALASHRVILDGELISFDAGGRPDFHRLRPRLLGRGDAPAVLAVFDVLHLDGHSTRRWPYCERRRLLAELLPARGPSWLVPAPLVGSVTDVLRVVAGADLEGIVAKRLDSAY